MNTLLIFFAFPIAVIIISAILQKLLKSPITVASLIFAIFLVVTFSAFDETFLIATFIYTVIALVTALVVRELCDESNNKEESDNCGCSCLNDLLNTNSNNNSNACGCNRYRRYR